ncbi:GerAB/ArcD/ProY family transporter [Paenibacillus sp. GCM10023248]|uniref:GerAB/ArcD/ProY family transporter n=1 Tax=Bacillales TaxID=1385 RepID=UPI0023787B7D|nr:MULTISPECIES: GerAB/ArcD/ProY family transporter [Bacillales]MDD9268291.1 GerAB/ArcD/ProY family transporter [Paenibacillus sp. MAHUQ-63]MDR6879969.1 spore germination protein (amino acid permease) [Bacillus sp. 3255]
MDKSISVVLMYVLTHLGLIFFLYPEDIISSTNKGHWVVILIGIAIHFAVIATYMKGLSYFPRWDIIRIYRSAGKGIALLFLVPILLYLFVVTVLSVRAYSEVITIIFLSSTPLWAIMLLLLVLSTYIASKGVETLFRTGVLLSILFLPLTLFIVITSFQNMDWNYALPIFDLDLSFVAKPSFYQSFFAFSGGFLFLGYLQPYFTYQRNKVLLAAAALIPFFIFSVYIPLLTFGESTAFTLHFPFVVVVDTLSINWLMFDRVTMFFLLSLITFIMLFISLTLWQINRMLSQSLPFIKPVYLLLSLSVVVFSFCLMIPDWKMVEKLLWWNTPLRLFVFVTVPLSVLLLGLRAKRKVSHEHS